MKKHDVPVNGGHELLIVDGDDAFCSVLSRYFTRRGFEVVVAHDVEAALGIAKTRQPNYVLVDLKVPDDTGLRLVAQIRAVNRWSKVVVLTNYASIATAVEAIKQGATDYIPKPVRADDVLAAFEPAARATGAVIPRPMSVNRVVWEYLNRVLMENSGNISATARALSMHRRTLQRMLRKHAFRN